MFQFLNMQQLILIVPDVDREKFDKKFVPILDEYLRLTSFVAVYYRDPNAKLVPHCSAYQLNKGIAFINIFECTLR